MTVVPSVAMSWTESLLSSSKPNCAWSIVTGWVHPVIVTRQLRVVPPVEPEAMVTFGLRE